MMNYLHDKVIKDLIIHKSEIKCKKVKELMWFYEKYSKMSKIENEVFEKYPLLKNYNGNNLKEYIYYINEKSKIIKSENE